MPLEAFETWKLKQLSRIDAAAKEEKLGGIEGLRNVVASDPIIAALGVLQYDMNAAAIKILGLPLDSPEAIYKAARIQGKAEGILHAISTLLELATLEVEDNGN